MSFREDFLLKICLTFSNIHPYDIFIDIKLPQYLSGTSATTKIVQSMMGLISNIPGGAGLEKGGRKYLSKGYNEYV